jgi:hypothetical protein
VGAIVTVVGWRVGGVVVVDVGFFDFFPAVGLIVSTGRCVGPPGTWGFVGGAVLALVGFVGGAVLALVGFVG